MKLVIPNLGNTTSGSGKTAQKNRKSQEIFDEFISLYIDKISLAVKWKTQEKSINISGSSHEEPTEPIINTSIPKLRR